MLAHTGLDIVAKLFGNRHVSRALKSVCFRSWGCRHPDQQMTRPTEFCPCIGLELRRVSFNGNATGHKSNHQGRTDTTAVIPVYVSRLAFRQMFICGFFFWNRELSRRGSPQFLDRLFSNMPNYVVCMPMRFLAASFSSCLNASSD